MRDGRLLLLASTAVAASAGLGCSLLHFLRRREACRAHLRQLEDALQHEKSKRAADRTGRIKAERQLRDLRAQQRASGTLESAGADDTDKDDPETQPGQPGGSAGQQPLVVRPIGTLRSCFNTRNGTPRQPLLVPGARAELQLSRGIPPACLDGLDQYSHCWVLYVFHCNTDMHQYSLADGAGGDSKVKAKIRVPRLDGGRMGVLATRTPHRPNPVGLSVAQVVSVSSGRLILGGADIVDGSPVLDIKPYIPFCDSCPTATAPGWVRAEADEEPLHIDKVSIGKLARKELALSWRRNQKRSLYSSAEGFEELVRQVLSRDIRSAYQRGVKQAGGRFGPEPELPLFTVVLDRVTVSYRVGNGCVEVTGACPWQQPQQRRELIALR